MPTREREPNHNRTSAAEIVLGIVNDGKLDHNVYDIKRFKGNGHRVDSADLAMAIFSYRDGNSVQVLQFDQERELAEYWREIVELTLPKEIRKQERKDFHSSEPKRYLGILQEDYYGPQGLPAIRIFFTHNRSVPDSGTITFLWPTVIPPSVVLGASQEAAKLELARLRITTS